MPGLRHLLTAAALALPAFAAANDRPWVAYQAGADFEDAVFEVRIAIENRGLVIDSVSHVGDMLNRTGPDLGATTRIFEAADVFQFCSADLSRKVMEADPMNIAFCPYGIFVARPAGGDAVLVGYRRMPEGPMQEVEAMLDAIAKEAAGLD